MSPDLLLGHINDFIEAPGGIERLRRFVVDLAILGKLDPKDTNITPVADLLGQIQIEKQKLVKENVVKKIKPQMSFEEDEIPVQGATNALFVRLAEIARLEKGVTGIQSARPGPYPLIGLAEERASSEKYQFDAKAAIVPLISSTGHGHASMKRLHYQEGKFALGNILCAVIPYVPEIISARFLYEYFCAYRDPLFVSKMIGTANVSLTIGKIAEAPVPIVTPEAQRRVDELMKLCDELEAVQAKRERRRDRLVAATLHGLNNGEANGDAGDTLSYEESARFYFSHLPRLTTRPEHIQQLRETILNLAVRGKLVPQNYQDEPAKQLIMRISAEKQVLIKKGEYKKQENLEPVGSAERPFEVPTGWEWEKAGSLLLNVTDGFHNTPKATEKGYKYMTAKHIRPGKIDFDNCLFVDEKNHKELFAKTRVKRGDILIVNIGAGCGTPAIVDVDFEFSFKNVAILNLPSDLDRNYVFMFLLHYRSLIFEELIKGGAQPFLGLNMLREMRIPVPPLAEQHRIAAKVDELMALCDEMEAGLKTSNATRLKLLDATLREALT